MVPPEANVFARRVSIPFGAGLVEAIPDDTIRDPRTRAIATATG